MEKICSNRLCHLIQITYSYCLSYQAGCIGDACNTHLNFTRSTQYSGNSQRPNSIKVKPLERTLM